MSSQPKDQKQSMLDTLLANIIHSSAIEGEKLNAFSVRSSLANKLGLSEEKPFPTTERTDGLAEIMLDAVENLDSPLLLERILQWHERLFPQGYTLFNPVIGGRYAVMSLCRLYRVGLINPRCILKRRAEMCLDPN